MNIIGAGGHARVVASVAIASGRSVAGFYDDNPALWGTTLDGIPVAGPIESVPLGDGNQAILGIGDNVRRRQLAERLDLDWASLIHPFAWAHPATAILPGTVICAGAIIQPGARIGSHVILNTRASVDHDCTVGDFAHLAVCHLSGGASVDEGVFMAVGCTVLPRVHVGAWAIVGAGAVVLKDVRPGTTVVGVPAKEIGPVDRTRSLEAEG